MKKVSKNCIMFLIYIPFFVFSGPTLSYSHEVFSYWAEVDKKQQGFTTVTRTGREKFTVSTLFSNGKKIDGDNFVATVIFYDRQNRAIEVVVHAAPLEPSYGGAATEAQLSTKIVLPTTVAEDFAWVGTRYFIRDRVDDERISGDLFKIAFAIVFGAVSDSDEDEGNLGAWTAGILSGLLLWELTDTSNWHDPETRPEDTPILSRMRKNHPQCGGYPKKISIVDPFDGDRNCVQTCDYHTKEKSVVDCVSVGNGKSRPDPRSVIID